jgi:hypothetical protein
VLAFTSEHLVRSLHKVMLMCLTHEFEQTHRSRCVLFLTVAYAGHGVDHPNAGGEYGDKWATRSPLGCNLEYLTNTHIQPTWRLVLTSDAMTFSTPTLARMYGICSIACRSQEVQDT